MSEKWMCANCHGNAETCRCPAAERVIGALGEELRSLRLALETATREAAAHWRTVESLRERLDSCEAERDEWKSHFDDERAKRVPAPPADAATEAVREAAEGYRLVKQAADECDCTGPSPCYHEGIQDAGARTVADLVLRALSTPAPAPSAPAMLKCEIK